MFKVTPGEPEYEAPAAQQAAESVATTGIIMLIVGIGLTGASSQAWGLINGLQIVVHMPMILLASFPETAQVIFDKLIDIA